jgi:plastocyanin
LPASRPRIASASPATGPFSALGLRFRPVATPASVRAGGAIQKPARGVPTVSEEAATLAPTTHLADLIPSLCALGVLWIAAFARPAVQARTASSAPAEVDFNFDPPTLATPVGATVTRIHREDEPHTVAFARGAFTSPALDTDESFSFRFDAPKVPTEEVRRLLGLRSVTYTAGSPSPSWIRRSARSGRNLVWKVLA